MHTQAHPPFRLKACSSCGRLQQQLASQQVSLPALQQRIWQNRSQGSSLLLSWQAQCQRPHRRHTTRLLCSTASAEGAFPTPPGLPADGDALIYSTLAQLDHELSEIEGQKAELSKEQEKSSIGAPESSNGSSSGGGPPPKGVPHRWQVVAMMALAFVLCNMDKVNMSVAVIPMAEELGWSATDRGLVSSAFFWGYSLTQVPAGWVSTKIGGAKVLLAGVAVWSLGTLFAPPAAKTSLYLLCATRMLVGLGEGLAPSSATSVIGRLIPESERTRAVTAVFGSLDVGSVVGLLVCGPLIRLMGWPSVFYLFAVLGLLWCLAWPAFRPEEPDADMTHVAQAATSNSGKAVPWATFLRSPAVWAIIMAHFCFNWYYYILLAWLPSFFELALGLNVQSSSLLTLIPYIAMVCMTPFVGPVADNLLKKGWELTNVRKLAQGISFLGPAICLLACASLTPPGARHAAGILSNGATAVILALLSISFALGAWSRGGLYCNHADLSPKYAGALLGISNTAGALPGVLGISSVGFLLDKTNSWGPSLFYPIIACQLFGLVIYTLFASSKSQGWE